MSPARGPVWAQLLPDSSPCPGSWMAEVQELLSPAPLLTRCAAAAATTILEEGRHLGKEPFLTLRTLWGFTTQPQKDTDSLVAAYKFSVSPLPTAGTPGLCACPQDTFGSRSWWPCRQEEVAWCALLSIIGKAQGQCHRLLSHTWEVKRLALTYLQKEVITVVTKASTTRTNSRISPAHSIFWERNTIDRLWHFFPNSTTGLQAPLQNLLATQFLSMQRWAVACCHPDSTALFALGFVALPSSWQVARRIERSWQGRKHYKLIQSVA